MSRSPFREDLEAIIARDLPGREIVRPELYPSREAHARHLRQEVSREELLELLAEQEPGVGLAHPEEYPTRAEIAERRAAHADELQARRTRSLGTGARGVGPAAVGRVPVGHLMVRVRRAGGDDRDLAPVLVVDWERRQIIASAG